MNFSGTLRINKFACFILIFIVFIILYFGSGSSNTTESSDFVNLKSLLNAAIFAAERGGRRVVEGSKLSLNMKSKGKTREGINDPVTDADYASHCSMFYSLKNTFPKLTVISEEHTKDESCSKQEPLPIDEVPRSHQTHYYLQDEHVHIKDVTVWIDPLDATKEFTEGLYEYVTTMVCVAVKGVPVIGVIHFPFMKSHTSWGWLMKQSSDDIENIAYPPKNKHQTRVIVSRSHPGQVTKDATDTFGPSTTITTAAGAGYKVITVANGTQDIYFHTTYIKKWDICAGDAIISTLGGRMTTLKGDRIDYSADSDVKVTDGLLVARFNHEEYLNKVLKTASLKHEVKPSS